MNDLIQMLKDEGIVEKLQRTINCLPYLDEEKKVPEKLRVEIMNHALIVAVPAYIDDSSNEELWKEFTAFSMFCGARVILDELDLKPEPGYVPSPKEAAVILATLLK